jgi:hypothetical protein
MYSSVFTLFDPLLPSVGGGVGVGDGEGMGGEDPRDTYIAQGIGLVRTVGFN